MRNPASRLHGCTLVVEMRRPSRRVSAAPDREAIAAALRTWRSAEALFGEPMFDRDRDLYENAVAALLPELSPADSVAALVRRYGDTGADDLPLANAACVGIDALSDAEILPRVVLDTAYWRRCKELIQAAVA
jgi:hypothetical protein